MFSHFSTLCKKGSINPITPGPFRVRVGLVGIIFAYGPYLHRAITYGRNKFFNLTPTVEKKSFHMVELYFSWKANDEALWWENVQNYFVQFWSYHLDKKIDVCSFLCWKVPVDIMSLSKIMSNSVLPSFVWKFIENFRCRMKRL